MALTTQDIIKILPYTEEFKKQLLDQFDQLNPDQKFNIVQIVWDTYNALYELKLDENTQIALQAVSNHRGKLDQTFYKQIKDKTEHDMHQPLTQLQQMESLSDARAQLQQIIKEQN